MTFGKLGETSFPLICLFILDGHELHCVRNALFVAQGFHWVEFRGLHRGQPAADYSNYNQN